MKEKVSAAFPQPPRPPFYQEIATKLVHFDFCHVLPWREDRFL